MLIPYLRQRPQFPVGGKPSPRLAASVSSPLPHRSRLTIRNFAAAPIFAPCLNLSSGCAFLLLAILLISAAAAHAQTYGRNFPICLQSCALGGCKMECDYTSLAQCNASAAGRAVQCLTNPYFAQTFPAGRSYRRVHWTRLHIAAQGND